MTLIYIKFKHILCNYRYCLQIVCSFQLRVGKSYCCKSQSTPSGRESHTTGSSVRQNPVFSQPDVEMEENMAYNSDAVNNEPTYDDIRT